MICHLFQVEELRAELVASLHPQALAERGGRAYLERLRPCKTEFDELIEGVVRDGEGLVEILGQPPTDPHSPLPKITQQLAGVRDTKKEVDDVWERAWQQPGVVERSEPIGQSPAHSSQGETTPPEAEASSSAELELSGVKLSGSVTSLDEEEGGVVVTTVTGGEVRKVSQVDMISKHSSDKFSELEEEAYEVRGVWSL